MSRGVQQGSVLGPWLWNVGYNNFLRMALPQTATIQWYTDDTQLFVSCWDWKVVGWKKNQAVALWKQA